MNCQHSTGLAFKAHEIEELADVYFFRPLGMAVARCARALSMTPTVVTLISAAFGVAGGLLFAVEPFDLVAFGLLMAHSVLDSSDGQLARMTGQTSELGRLLDGASGYVTHAAIYVAMAHRAVGGGGSYLALTLVAAIANIVHAQMYDYYRGSYAAAAIEGMLAADRAPSRSPLLAAYEAVQHRLAGAHRQVEAAIAARARAGAVRDEDRARYRRFFYWPVRGWNLLGDNTRFYALGLLAWMHRVDWFPLFVLVPMNAAFLALWSWQARVDRRFLASL